MNKNTSEEELYKVIASEGLLASTPGHIYWKNRNGVFLGCNNEQALFFGFKDQGEIVGKTNFDLVDYDAALKISEADNKVVKTGETQIVEEILHGPRYFLSKKMPLKNSKGEIVGILGTSIDITQQKLLEQSLKKRTQELAKALEAKQRFIRNLCHEIRTPMQPVLTMPQCLKEHFYTMTDETKLEFIDCAIDGATRLTNLLTNLLDISKFQQGKFVLEFKLENLKALLAEVVQEFHLSHGNIKLSVDDDVQQEILCDKFRLHQVLRNLITNSIRYGSQAKPITISASNLIENDTKYIKFSVKDDGVGIPEDERAGIFEAFVESTLTRSNAGGTGLGLAIAKEIIESHRGRIWVDDTLKEEVGTRISFTVPSHMSRTQFAQAQHTKSNKIELESVLTTMPGHV
jgi:two-component system aerobic respiration control sensor histidine kinase ArcB